MPVSDAEVADLLKALSVTQAPLVRKNVRTVLDFFRRYDPRTDRGKLLSILRATDLHTEVREELLWHGEVLGRFAATGREYGDFYTKAGTSQWILGIRPAGKQFRRFRVSRPSPVLVSRAAGVVTTLAGAAGQSGSTNGTGLASGSTSRHFISIRS